MTDAERLAHLKSLKYRTAFMEQEIKLLEAREAGKHKNFKAGDLVSVSLPYGRRYGKILEVFDDGTAIMQFAGFFGDTPVSGRNEPINVPMGNMRKWNGVLPKSFC